MKKADNLQQFCHSTHLSMGSVFPYKMVSEKQDFSEACSMYFITPILLAVQSMLSNWLLKITHLHVFHTSFLVTLGCFSVHCKTQEAKTAWHSVYLSVTKWHRGIYGSFWRSYWETLVSKNYHSAGLWLLRRDTGMWNCPWCTTCGTRWQCHLTRSDDPATRSGGTASTASTSNFKLEG